MSLTSTPTVGQKFFVAGMTCRHCERAVAAEVRQLDGVTSVVVDATAGTVITESVEPLPLDAVAEAVAEAGYELVGPALRAAWTGR
jgi:copper chaperone CopZ